MFGQEAQDPTSALLEQANAYTTGFQGLYGKDIYERIPDLASAAFWQAHHQTKHLPMVDENKRLTLEIQKLKEKLAFEPGSRFSQPAPEGVAETLKNGGTTLDAIKQLGQVRGLAGIE